MVSCHPQRPATCEYNNAPHIIIRGDGEGYEEKNTLQGEAQQARRALNTSHWGSAQKHTGKDGLSERWGLKSSRCAG